MRPIRVLYDDRGFRQKFGGVSRCFAETIRRLPGDISWKIAARSTVNEFFHAEPYSLPYIRKEFTCHDFCRKFLGGHYIPGIGRTFGWIRRIVPEVVRYDHGMNDRYFRQEALKPNVDILHLTEPHVFDYNWRRIVGRKPVVITVHDLIPDERTDLLRWFDEKMCKCRRSILERADAIVAVSNYTKEKIVSLYGIRSEKIHVVHHGPMIMNSECRKSPVGVGKYILYVGARWTYKNFGTFVEGAAPLLRSDKDLYLVCTGEAFSDPETALLKSYGIDDKVVQKFIPDDQMLALYANAQAFVYPSLVEGFGIPILDAFSAGCPVILSKCSCFPEVAGEAACYFEGTDPASLTVALSRVLNNREYAAELRRRGAARVKDFSWEKAASEIAEVYRGLVRGFRS